MLTIAKKSSVGFLTAVLIATGGVASAEAAEIHASISGATAHTTQSRARAWVTDTLDDNMRADVDYKRGNASAASQTTSATGGKGSEAQSAAGTTIATIRACRRNNNPLQGDACSAWMTL
ncbi:MAG: hypothetical protein LBK95_16240 [Bifidobacteriaceae bacterium]|jgi:hypothetical protein|nr:hypothetical protein [Bifidobacteriaceae bacterium]